MHNFFNFLHPRQNFKNSNRKINYFFKMLKELIDILNLKKYEMCCFKFSQIESFYFKITALQVIPMIY